MSAELVIFDLGGTTVHDRGEVPAAFAEALTASRIPFDPKEVDQWRGASKREVLRQLVEQQHLDVRLVDVTYQTFRASLLNRFSVAAEIAFPASATAFQLLHRCGVPVGLNSGFDRDIVNLVITLAGWDLAWFSSTVCSEDVSRGRPAPDMIRRSMEIAGISDAARVAVVGDTRLDLEAGLRAGAGWRIGVLSGAHDRATLERAPFTHILPDVSGVPGILGIG